MRAALDEAEWKSHLCSLSRLSALSPSVPLSEIRAGELPGVTKNSQASTSPHTHTPIHTHTNTHTQAFYSIDLSRKREDEPCFGSHLVHLKNHLAHHSLQQSQSELHARHPWRPQHHTSCPAAVYKWRLEFKLILLKICSQNVGRTETQASPCSRWHRWIYSWELQMKKVLPLCIIQQRPPTSKHKTS